MDTIKVMVVRKLQQKGNGNEDIADYIVSEEIRRHLKNIARFFPNDTPEGREFNGIMSRFMVKGDCMLIGKKADETVGRTINALLEKIMNEPDNLDEGYYVGYMNLRSLLVDAINNRR